MEPGSVHYRVAETVLRGIQDRAATRGITLDVGEFPTAEDAVGSDDPQRVAKLAARAIARAGDKLGFLRKISRGLEGSDRRAGLVADIIAVVVALAERNPEATQQLARDFARELQERRAAQPSAQNGGAAVPKAQPKPQPGGVAPHA